MVIQIQQAAPKGGGHQYALVPFGTYLNAQLQKAVAGDLIDFCDGWERQRRVLSRVCKLEVDSAVFSFLCDSIYGEGRRLEDMRKVWEAQAVIEGFGQQAFNTDYVYLIETVAYCAPEPDKTEADKAMEKIWRIAGEEREKDGKRRRRKAGKP